MAITVVLNTYVYHIYKDAGKCMLHPSSYMSSLKNLELHSPGIPHNHLADHMPICRMILEEK